MYSLSPFSPSRKIIDPSRKRSSVENVASSFISAADSPRSLNRSTLSSDLIVTCCISRLLSARFRPAPRLASSWKNSLSCSLASRTFSLNDRQNAQCRPTAISFASSII